MYLLGCWSLGQWYSLWLPPSSPGSRCYPIRNHSFWSKVLAHGQPHGCEHSAFSYAPVIFGSLPGNSAALLRADNVSLSKRHQKVVRHPNDHAGPLHAKPGIGFAFAAEVQRSNG